MKKLLDIKFLHNLIKFLVISLPLFFVPLSPMQLGADNYSKFYLLSFCTLILFGVFIAIKKGEGSIRILHNELDRPMALLLFVFLISSFFGASRIDSFFGNLSSTVLPFFLLADLCLLYFLFVNIFDNNEKRISILKWVLYSFPVISILSFIVIFFYNSNNPLSYLRMALGTAADLSVYLSILVTLVISIYSSDYLKDKFGIKNKIKLLFDFTLWLAVFLLISTNFSYGWWLLLFGMLIVLVFRIKMNKETAIDAAVKASRFATFRKRYLAPILLGLIAVNFLLNFYIVSGQKSLEERLVKYRQLTNTKTVVLLKNVIADNLFFGVGLENFDYAFSKYRPVEMNAQEFWDIRFNKSGSFLLYLIVSGGLIGLMALAYVFFIFLKNLFLPVRNLIKKSSEAVLNEDDQLNIAMIPAIAIILISLAFYTDNVNILFLLVLLSALFISTIPREKVLFEFSFDQEKQLKGLVLLGLSLVVSIIYMTYATKYVVADFGLGQTDRSEKDLLRATELSSGRYQHYLNLSKFYLEKAKQESKNGNLDTLLELQDKSLKNLAKAEEVGAYSVVAQESAGVIFRDFSQGGDGLNMMSIKAFEKAKSLEPSNPVLAVELGQALLKSEEYEQAEENFQAAIKLKADYKQAELGMAKAMSGLGKNQEAIDLLERLSKESSDPNVYYELGLKYFNEDRNKEAISAFNNAITLSPLHSNALYGMALAMEKEKDIKQAIYYLKKVQKLNPNNAEIANKLKSLEK